MYNLTWNVESVTQMQSVANVLIGIWFDVTTNAHALTITSQVRADSNKQFVEILDLLKSYDVLPTTYRQTSLF